MRKQRLAFAKMYVHWRNEEWKKVMFSDESNFQVLGWGLQQCDVQGHLTVLTLGVQFQL